MLKIYSFSFIFAQISKQSKTNNDDKSTFEESYRTLLTEIKAKIQHAQVRAVIAVNQQMLLLYWEIGRIILERQKSEGWGAKITEQLSQDLKNAFPNLKGFSKRNLLYMKQFAESNPEFSIAQVPLAQLSWYHNITLLEKCHDNNLRLWYAQQTLENGWSRNVMVLQIESNLHLRQGNSTNNFAQAMPSPQSELAQQIFKDPYILDFIGLQKESLERDMEKALIHHITNFLLELGTGFAFMGSQFHLEIGGDDFYIDLLFYHLQLRSYVAIDLKMTKFKPEYSGKMNFYLSALDDKLKTEQDQPSIGIILCKEKNKVVAEYALRGIRQPIGVSEFELTRAVPADLQAQLPSIEALERELMEVKIAAPE